MRINKTTPNQSARGGNASGSVIREDPPRVQQPNLDVIDLTTEDEREGKIFSVLKNRLCSFNSVHFLPLGSPSTSENIEEKLIVNVSFVAEFP